MTAVELLPPGTGPDDERWHQLRREGVTASEIAAVLGISPWESPFGLYWKKVNDWRTDDADLLSTGRHLEDAIASWWVQAVGQPIDLVTDWAGLYAHAERPWQLATPDRLLVRAQLCGACDAGLPMSCTCDAVALLECKWVAYSWDGWGEPGTDEIPVYYRAQALWQLDVLGVDEVHFAALGPGGFRAYGPIRRDEDDLEVMRKAGAEFHRRLTESDPPSLDSHRATLGALKRLHPTVGEGDVEIGRKLAADYHLMRLQRKAADEAIALYEAQIRDLLGSTYARAVTATGHLVASRSVFEQQRIDSKRLRAEQPDIAAAYTLTTTVDRLNPGRITHDPDSE